MAIILIAVLAVDFGKITGAVRPELHSSGFGPTICSQTEQDLADVKSMGFLRTRTHDWGLVNPNERVCDYFHIFPLMHLDAQDPKNYVFGPTDYLLKRTREEAGLEIFYRLGTSIEHSGTQVHFNSLMPDDFGKVAETFAGTVRHYNRGWADGYKWNIRYWEIWNEPEGMENMWCPKNGFGKTEEEVTAQKREMRDRFVEFFVTVLKRLKSEFGDEIKVGGPALQCYREEWFLRLFAACRDAGVVPDFISWHGYEHDPMVFNRDAERAKKMCEKFGFAKCELIVDEWHYFGENYDWSGMQHSSDQKVKARIWSGPDSHNGIRSACFTLAALANMQRSKLDQAYYYGCGHEGDWGFKDGMQRKYKVYYALKAFGELLRKYTIICESTSEGSVTMLAVKDADGRMSILVVDYGGTARTISMSIKGVSSDAHVSCRVLDHGHDLEPHTTSFKDGVLTLVKPDFFSAAFVVEFQQGCDGGGCDGG